MKKSNKKLEKLIVHTLTDVCEHQMKKINGFEWLTHHIDYNTFTDSFKVFCVFENTVTLNTFLKSEQNNVITQHIIKQLNNVVGSRVINEKRIEYLTDASYSQRYVNKSYH